MRPRRATIDGGVVAIEYDARLGRLAEGYGRAGDHSAGRVRLAAGMPSSTLRGALLHELLHELWLRAALDDFLSLKTEELVIDALVPWLLALLRENPALVEFITEGA